MILNLDKLEKKLKKDYATKFTTLRKREIDGEEYFLLGLQEILLRIKVKSLCNELKGILIKFFGNLPKANEILKAKNDEILEENDNEVITTIFSKSGIDDDIKITSLVFDEKEKLRVLQTQVHQKIIIVKEDFLGILNFKKMNEFNCTLGAIGVYENFAFVCIDETYAVVILPVNLQENEVIKTLETIELE